MIQMDVKLCIFSPKCLNRAWARSQDRFFLSSSKQWMMFAFMCSQVSWVQGRGSNRTQLSSHRCWLEKSAMKTHLFTFLEGRSRIRLGLAFKSLNHQIRETIPKSQRQEAEPCSLLEMLVNEVQVTKKILLGCPLELMIKEKEFYSGLNWMRFHFGIWPPPPT